MLIKFYKYGYMALLPRILRNTFNRRRLNLKRERLQSLNQLLLLKAKRKYQIKRITNICVLTGAGKSVYKYVGLSRHMLKRYANQGKIVGFKRSSW
jgi:ribosomal protein S14